MNSEQFLLLSHCLLNQTVRAGGAYNPGVGEKLLTLLGQYQTYIYQLPCPEYLFLGERDKKPQDVWEKMEGFKKFCSDLALEVKKRCEKIIEGKVPILIAIARSPSCSASQVQRGKRLVEGRGLWILELEKKLNFDIIEFDFKKVKESLYRLKDILNKRANYFGA